MSVDFSEAWRRGKEAWPDIEVGENAFLEHARGLWNASSSADAQDQSAPSGPAVHGPDLYLALAAHGGDPVAIRELERLLGPLVDAAVMRLKVGLNAQEARQIVRERLLLGGAKGGGTLAEYAGRGRLQSWLRVVVVRAILNRAAPPRELAFTGDVLERLLGVGGDVELGYMKRLYREEFRAAFAEALASLEARHKNLIRLAFVEGLTIDTLGTFYGVHRATVARWIAQAERVLFDAIRVRFRERLGVDEDEYASILRLVKSRLDVTFENYLSRAED